MALECGTALHEVFAAVRLWQLDRVQGLPKHTKYNGARIFGELRWNMCWNHCVTHTDERDQLLELCFAILKSGNWKDDEKDHNEYGPEHLIGVHGRRVRGCLSMPAT